MRIIENEEAIEILKSALGRATDMLIEVCDHEVQYSGEWQELQDIIKEANSAMKITEGCS